MHVTKNELTDSEMENKIEGKSSWADTSILTNDNQDRIAINHVRDKSFSGKSNQLVIMWLKIQKKSIVVEGRFA